MGLGARDRRMRHPDLLIGPAFALRSRLRRLAEQRPLQAASRTAAVDQVRREIPPLDAKLRMRPVIGWEGEGLSRCDLRKAIGRLAEAGIALRMCAARESECGEAAGEGAAR